MAHWISSKLKAAETILQQIDHQAAESLRKNERSRAEEITIDTPTKTGGTVSLKDQLKKKTQESVDYHGKLRRDPSFTLSSPVPVKNNSASTKNDIVGTPKSPPKPKTTLTDSDWTQLLSTPDPATLYHGGNGVPGIRALRKDGRRQHSAGSHFSVPDVKKNQRTVTGASKPARGLGSFEGSKLNGKASDGEESGFPDSAGRPSSDQLQIDGKYLEMQESDHMEAGPSPVVKSNDEGNEENGGARDSKDVFFGGVSGLGKTDGISDNNHFSRTVLRKHEWKAASSSSISDSLKRVSSSVSDGSAGSDSESDSGSTSDSELEREREEGRRRKEKIMAEKAAARALEVLKEMENMVARLEGEKQSLEKILEEQAKQQAQEASMLHTTMIETMEAVELEKQKHNNTRMEVLARLAKLETVNADLARTLATVQWNLEEEVNRVAELRQKIELKKLNNEELRWKISNAHQTGTSLKKQAAPKGLELEREIIEAEYSFMTDKIARLQEKAKKLGSNIEMTGKEMEEPTYIEVELTRRLGQLTDHLIQKQSQVEALSAEKATLLFRIEAISRLLDERKSMTDVNSAVDLESGTWELSDSKFGTLFEGKIRSSRKKLYSLVHQMDAIFLAGAVFLRRNSKAKMWSVVYLICLHFWVIYILVSHSQPSYETKSGAVISLENINNTAGVYK